MKKILVLITMMFIALSGIAAHADTATLGSDADTWMRDGYTENGDDPLMNVAGIYGFYSYLRFDLSSLGAIEITDVSLTLKKVPDGWRNDTMVTGRFQLYGMNDVAGNTAQDWGEMDLTWNNAGAEFDTGDNTLAAGVADGRLVNLDADDAGINTTETVTESYTVMTVTGADLIAFLQDRANDGGLATFIMTCPDWSRAFALGTKEATDPTNVPVLQITYTKINHANSPTPEDASTVPLNSVTQLSWSNPDPNDPNDTITSDVYFGTTEPNALFPNYGLTLIENDITLTDANIPAASLPLNASTTYWWVVDCTDPNGGGNPVLLPGQFWSFYVSGAPVIVTDPVATAKFETETADFSARFTTDEAITSGWPKWYKVGDPDTEVLVSDPDVTITLDYDSINNEYISGLSVANLEGADEALYYCEIANTNGTAQTASAKLVVKRLLAYWTFDTDPNDTLHNYDGVATGSPVYDTGKVGNAIVFDGSDDLITLPAGFDDFSAGMTISVWANPAAVTNWGRFIDFGNAGGTDDILFARNGTSNTLRFDFAPWPGAVDAVDALALNVWQMFVVTMDEAGNVVIYKDGLPVHTDTVSSLPSVVTRTSNFIGESNWASDALYQGMMDDMRIYNYGLTADAVADLYSGVVGDYCRNKPVYDLTGDCRVNLDDLSYLAGYWLDCGFYPDPLCQ